MADDISLVIGVDSSQVQRAVQISDNLESELRNVTKAEKIGLITRERAVAETKRLNDQMARLKKVSSGGSKDFYKFDKALSGSAKSARRNEVAFQQAGYQIQDFIVQVQGGTNPLIAFSQQGSQLAGFFAGPWGAMIGLGIAALSSLGMAFLATSNSAKSFEDQIKDTTSTLDEYFSLLKANSSSFDDVFERNSASIKLTSEAAKDLLALAKIEAFSEVTKLGQSLSESVLSARYLKTELEDVGSLIGGSFADVVSANLGGKAGAEIRDMVEALRELGLSETLDQQYQYALRAREIFKQNVDINGSLTEEQRNFLRQISLAIQKMELLGAVSESNVEVERLNLSVQQSKVTVLDIIARKTRENSDAVAKIKDSVESELKDLSSKKDILELIVKHGKDSHAVAIAEAKAARDLYEERKRSEGILGNNLKAVMKLYDAMEGLKKEAAETSKNLDILFRSRTVMYSIRFAGEESVMAQGFDGPSKTSMSYEELKAAGVSEANIAGMGVTKPRGSGGGGSKKSPAQELQEYLDQLQQQADLESQLVGLFGEKRDTEEEVIKARQKYGSVFTAAQEKELRGTLAQIEADKERQRVLEEAKSQQQSIADTLQSSMSTAFMSMVDGTKSFKDAMKDMARAVIKQLFEILVVQRLVGSFNATTGTGSGIVGAIMGATQADGGAWRGGSQIKAYANGGVVGGPTYFPMAGGKTGLMGEAGPEAIMPLKRGANGKLGVQAEGGSQGSVVVNQSFNFSANGDESVKKIIAQAAPQIANMTQKQIMDSRRRGGSMKATFG